MDIKSLNWFSPIRKPQKLPERLIYHKNIETIFGDYYDSFRMFNTNTGELLGKMAVIPILKKIEVSSFYPKEDRKPSLYIMDLHSYDRDKGVGSSFIKFAKILSKKLGMNGRLHLISSDMYDRECPPHVFYRKQGFTSTNIELVKEIDDHLLGKASGALDFESLRMYYNPNAHVGEYDAYVPPKLSLKGKVMKSVKGFLRKHL